MLGVLVVSHGQFAEELVNAARTIVGDVPGLEAISIGWNDDVSEATDRILEAIGRVDGGSGVLLMTDMFGGTPTNLALSLHEAGRVEIITGVNLPMLIKCANLREELELHTAANRIADEGRRSIQVATRILEPDDDAGDESDD